MKQYSVVRSAKPKEGQRAAARLRGRVLERGCGPDSPLWCFHWGPAISKSLSHNQSPRGLLEQAVSTLNFELNCLTHMPTNRSPTHPIRSHPRVAGLTYPATPPRLKNAKAAEGMLNAIWQCGARYWSNKREPKLEKTIEHTISERLPGQQPP